jgi:hypothetical protein
MQDTIYLTTIFPKNLLKQISDTTLQNRIVKKDTAQENYKSYHSAERDKTSSYPSFVCERNAIADITFNDSNNIISKNKLITSDRFPYLFTEKNISRKHEESTSLLKHLRNGETLHLDPFHNDWTFTIILFAAFLYSLIKTASRTLWSEAARFFFFRGINDSGSREIGGLFYWQSTLLNFISFVILGLFSYFTLIWFDLIPFRIQGFIGWLISVGFIAAAITLRHLICVITGSLSGERDAFREYLLGVYQSYRFCAIIIYIIVILISYTYLLPVQICFFLGFFALIMIYLIRIIRLFLIFINRNISIFYLILYLCALEILPVLILLKYFTGIV